MITTVVGSYPKLSPDAGAPSLRAAISRHDAGRITVEELRRVEDDVTREVIQEQIDAGIDLITDGQIRRDDGQTYFARGIKGFTINGLIRYFDTNTYYRHPIPERRLEWQGAIGVGDLEFAVAHSARPVKGVITGPYTLARLSQMGCYRDLRSLVMDLVPILNREALALQQAGAEVVQFDEPAILQHKDDFDLFAEAVEGVTRGVTARTAVYTYFRDVSGIHSRLFQLPVDIIGLDFVAGPANYDLVRDFPPDKMLGFGIVDARNTCLETVEEIASAIGRVSRVVSPDRLHVNPSCGLDFLPRKSARAKLARLVDGVRRAQEVRS
ncbi:MAG: 5-methyltetrahydropteroyltriglutamate--homocysteine methyltransferase [Dehalococcoidia bacterium]|nr:5-methyltetrahydropteroyltriglutamate--homocysteine methyltransferase [Dehalococcoidia bacterium]